MGLQNEMNDPVQLAERSFIEAMASGVPVLASNTNSLPEVVGDADVLGNLYDIDELREAMQKLLDDGKMRCEMSEKGLERSKLFSREKCAKGTITIYQKVLRQKR